MKALLPILEVLLTLSGFVGMGRVSSKLNQGPVSESDAMDSSDVFWMEAIKHQGASPFNPDPTYQVFRNVKDFGAKGDGVTDDTEAINRAISSGNRCGGGDCRSSTITPAIVYFPKGVYVVSKAIIAYYYTQLIGDPKNPPTLEATSSFTDMAVIDADPYIPGGGGRQWYTNQNNFFRSVRNFVIDVRKVPPGNTGTGIHWQVAQGTSLMNIVFYMSSEKGTAHQGIWMENGSGGFMGDLVFNGGKFGIWAGNQQFTVRNVTINNAQTAFYGLWNWGWTFQGLNINNCAVGFDLSTGGRTGATQTVGSETIVDAVVCDTPIFIRSSAPSTGELAGSLVIHNARLSNVAVAVATADGTEVLSGGTKTIRSWAQGNIYAGSNPSGSFYQGDLSAPSLPPSTLDSNGAVVSRTHPQYVDHSVDDFVSVKDYGAVGDGQTDDTEAIERIMEKFAQSKIIFFDAGIYIVTKTVTVPAGARIVGEAWSVLAGRGHHFQDHKHPHVVIRVGEEHSTGIVEITDMIFSTVGPSPGAIVVEWNVRGPSDNLSGPGMWDSHIVLGGRAGSNLESDNCPAGSDDFKCSAAFLAMHLTRESTAYLEGTWIWLADHDLDRAGEAQITLFSARGLLSESAGPVWLVGTAEHHSLYQYNFFHAENHYVGHVQTETAYYQPTPPVPLPYGIDPAYHDPTYPDGASGWGLRFASSKHIHVFGAGIYSFFRSYSQECLKTHSCQNEIVDVDSKSEVYIYSLNTVGTTYQLSVDQKPIVMFGANVNGFADTVTFWGPS